MTATAIALLAFYMAISIADVLTTERVLRRGGRETWPIVWLMNKIGRPAAYAVKMAVALAIGIVAAFIVPMAIAMGGWTKILTIGVLTLFLGFGCWVVWHNWRQVK